MAVVIVSLAWPYLGQDRQRQRALALANQVAALREDARKSLMNRSMENLRKTLSRRTLLSLLAPLLRFVPLRDLSGAALRLQQAGFRSNSALSVYASSKLFLAFAFPVAGYLYIEAILRVPPVPLIQAALLVAAAACGFMLPDLLVSNRINKRRAESRRYWPDALDLLIICVEGGLTVETAIRRVAAEIGAQSAVLAEELSIATAELSYLKSRQEAFERLSQRLNLPVVTSAAMALIQSEKYGTPVGKALAVLARESRIERLNEAEKKAAALGPKLTVPMIVFFLPVLFAIVLAPVLLQAVK